jgi:hypothetical protein
LHVLTDAGEDLFLPLERIKTARGGNPGRYRFYNEYELPPEYLAQGLYASAFTATTKTLTAGSTARSTCARSRRPIPTTTPTARGASTPRASTASSRTPSTGAAHTVLATSPRNADLLGFGLGMNALSWHRHRKRDGSPAAA